MDYYEEYDGADGSLEDDYDFYQMPQSSYSRIEDVVESWRACIQPSVAQTAGYVIALIGINLLCHFVWFCCRRCLPRRGIWLQHSASVLSGFALLYFAVGHDFLIVLFLAILAYVLMLLVEYLKYKRMGPLVAVLTIASHFVYELLWDKPEAWQRIRGIQMVATMKIISLAFDLDAMPTGEEQKGTSRIRTIPALVPFLGYLFCPASCVLGPWIPYEAYVAAMQIGIPRGSFTWLLCCCLLNVILAVGFLCLSNCLVPLLCTDYAWQWLRTYRDALSVRCSHYFICFLSQATLVAAGVAPNTSDSYGRWLGYAVTKPLAVEMPRSLSSVVRNWNIPMHDWLKRYVFQPFRIRFLPGQFLAPILGTYLVSALLHGLHVQIYAVLLSLGVFAYIETVLRRKLSMVFNACITAQPCRRTACAFANCSSRGWRRVGAVATVLVNGCFALLAVLHLAYLGIMMNTSDTDNESGPNIWKWSNLGYLSHWLALASYIFYLSI